MLGKLTTDHILVLCVLVECRYKFQQEIHAAYVNLKKALNSVHHEAIWDLL